MQLCLSTLSNVHPLYLLHGRGWKHVLQNDCQQETCPICGLFSYLFIHSCRGSSSDNSMSGFCHAVNVTSCPAGQTCSSLTGCGSLDTAAGHGELGLENTDNITDIVISDLTGVVRSAGVSPVPALNTRGLLSSGASLPHTEAAPAAAPPLPRLQDNHHVYTCRHV